MLQEQQFEISVPSVIVRQLSLNSGDVLEVYGLKTARPNARRWYFAGDRAAWLAMLDDVRYRTGDAFDPDCVITNSIAKKFSERLRRLGVI